MRAYAPLALPPLGWLVVPTVGGGVDMCEYVGVGVRDFAPPTTWVTWVEGGGVMLLPEALEMRFDCIFSIAVVPSTGRSACAGWGVMGALIATA